jgi:two-component system, LytTR family, response regulator
MEPNKFTYLVIENAPDVCEGIIRRMNQFENWQSLGYCVGVKEAIEKIGAEKPNLLYLDWSLNGGSAFEILQQVQNLSAYNPYIIFNTGFQKDNPEIPQEIINKYKVDKYLVKPLWENLRNNLPQYLKEAEEKIMQLVSKKILIWIEDDNKNKVQIDLSKIICICQHPTEPRSRNIYMYTKEKEITIPLQWQKFYDLLQQNGIDFFITKNRSHLVIKQYVEKFEKPFVRLRGLTAFKIDVVKESIKDFERWLIG